MPRLAGTPSLHSPAPAPVPGRDTRCSSFGLDRQGLFASSIAGKANHRRLQRFSGDSSPHRRAQGQHAVRRRAAHNGLELSCRASRIRFRISRFSAAGPVSCSELLGGPNRCGAPSATELHQTLADPGRIFDIAPASLNPMLLLEYQLALLRAQVAFDQVRAGG
jgi:hypothetical protein